MKILVFVKQVPDPNAIRFDGTGNFSPNTPRVLNEYDAYGLEEAIRVKEAKGDAVEVVVASLGPAAAKDAISRGLAMGTDRGILVTASGRLPGSLATANVLARIAGEDQYDLIWVGQETSDSGTGNVGPQLSALLGVPFVSNVVGFELNEDASVTLTREIEDGHARVKASLPVIACALSGLSEPRYPSLQGIMAARKKPIDERSLDEFDFGGSSVEWGGLREEERTIEGIMIEETDAESAAHQLVELLRERDLI